MSEATNWPVAFGHSDPRRAIDLLGDTAGAVVESIADAGLRFPLIALSRRECAAFAYTRGNRHGGDLMVVRLVRGRRYPEYPGCTRWFVAPFCRIPFIMRPVPSRAWRVPRLVVVCNVSV